MQYEAKIRSIAKCITSTVRGSNAGRGNSYSCFPKRPDRFWGPTQPPFQWYPSSFVGVNRLGREINRSPPFSAVVENAWSYTSTPPLWRGQVQLYLVLVSLNPLGRCLPNVSARGPLSASKS